MKTTHCLQYIETRSKIHRDVVYGKYQVVIPEGIIAKTGWQVGQRVDFQVDRSNRVIMSASTARPELKKMTYDEARVALFNILIAAPQGLTWTEIHERNQHLPMKPNPFWVQRFEIDLGVRREVNGSTGKKLWRIPTMLVRTTHQLS